MCDQNILKKKRRSEHMLEREGKKCLFRNIRILFVVKNTRMPLPLSYGIRTALMQRSETSDRTALSAEDDRGELLRNSKMYV